MAEIRRAEPRDFPAAALLLHRSAATMYDRFAGGRKRALALLERSLREPGNASSADVVWVAELDGRVVGAMAGFPVAEALARSRSFLALALRAAPPWRWPLALSLYWAGGRASPSPPPRAFYVDALATDAAFERRGVASALLAEAERLARARRLPAIALDTTMDNAGARALYARAGYSEVAYRAAGRGLPGFVALVKELR
ncbi:MAG TPA: GNAT family N-acetyltransferase [Thermoleophilaceae bacterium]|nr:GNAT family N-acetyltransferase [Thermoleophilaceae bacterium]